MKRHLNIMPLLATLVLHLVLPITPANAAPITDSPLLGRWALDVTDLPMPPDLRPHSVTLEFADTDGKLSTHVEIQDQNRQRMYSESTLTLDATPGHATGTYWVDVLAASMPTPDVLVMQFVYQGIPRSTRIYTISTDKKVLTETETYFKDDATPATRVAHFNRLPAQP